LPEHLERTTKLLNDRMQYVVGTNQPGIPRDIRDAVIRTDIVQGEALYGYVDNKRRAFIKITVAVPRLVTTCMSGVLC
jgi:hypothetical protein